MLFNITILTIILINPLKNGFYKKYLCPCEQLILCNYSLN
jgi:hypothetical protein